MSEHPQVVIISDKQDAHVPFVQRHLDQALLLDPRDILSGVEWSYEPNGHGTQVRWKGEVLRDVSGVWYRRPQYPDPATVPVADAYKGFSASALSMHAFQLTTAFPDAVWVSDYYAIQRAQNKSWQLSMAQRIGFRVPRTLMTSSPERARTFIATEDVVITKPMSVVKPVIDGKKTFFYTRRLDKQNPPKLDTLRFAPAIFQQAIDTKFDVRVAVVGAKTFAVAIHSDNENRPELQDWRGNQDSARYEPFALSNNVTKHCVDLVAALGLTFGAIDLLMDKKDRIWFLEINPNGQWAFMEQECELPIGRALADLLTNKRKTVEAWN